MKRIFLLFTLLACCIYSFGQFKKATYTIAGKTLPYRVMLPENYDAEKPYPLVVLLHGGGERGSDNEKQLVHGKQFLVDHFQSAYPAIVLVPQCPTESYWANVSRSWIEGEKMEFLFGLTDQPSEAMEVLIPLINYWLSSGKVDLRKVYVGGLSMGGMGTFEILWRMPNVFAASFAICGGADTAKFAIYAQNTAIWIFHGESDSVVPVDLSRDAYTKLKERGCDVKYTEYEGVDHGSWENAFQERELAPWLFSHSR